MGFLKNLAIKRVTKKRFDQLVGLIELPAGNNQPIDPMQTLRDYIKAVESSGGTIEVPPDITDWLELFVYLVCMMVRSELAYDPTMGSEQDLNLIVETVNKQLKKWKKESIFNKFVRRSKTLRM